MSTELITRARAYLKEYGLWRTLLRSLQKLGIDSSAEWRKQRKVAEQLPYQPEFSLLLVAQGSNPRGLQVTIKSLRAQSYARWQLCLVIDHAQDTSGRKEISRYIAKDRRIKLASWARFRSQAIAANEALRSATGEFIALIATAGDQLAPNALFAVAALLNVHPDADLIYTDENKVSSSGVQSEPVFKPGWAPDQLTSEMFLGDLSTYRRALVDEVGGFREQMEGAHKYDLALRVTKRDARIHHIPEVLYHRHLEASSEAPSSQTALENKAAVRRVLDDYLQSNQIDASYEETTHGKPHRIRYRINDNPLVSIIIPTAGLCRVVEGREMDLLANCVRSIIQTTEYQNYEVLCVVDGGYQKLREETKQAISALHDGRIRFIPFDKPFNFAEKMNYGVEHAAGEHLLFLNDDTEVITAEWLTAMLEYSQQRDVGAVGAKLYFPNFAIQHAGVVIAIGSPGHVFYGCSKEQQEGIEALDMVRNYAAVTGACLMTRRDAFAEVGGFNEAFAVNFNDVDYCLKIREHGYRIVYTPYAELFHFESLSRTAFKTQGYRPEEIKLFNDTWGGRDRDPYYNRFLNLIYFGHVLASAAHHTGNSLSGWLKPFNKLRLKRST